MQNAPKGLRFRVELLQARKGIERMKRANQMSKYSESVKKMIARRIAKGGNASEAPTILNDLINSHDGENLVYVLCYWNFATESKAREFAFKTDLPHLAI